MEKVKTFAHRSNVDFSRAVQEADYQNICKYNSLFNSDADGFFYS